MEGETEKNCGDDEHFVRLLTRHERALYRYVVSLLPAAQEADDVMQDTASILWKKFADYDSSRPFLPWAMRFAYLEVLKLRRKKGRNRLVFSDELVEKLAEDYPVEEALLASRRKALETCLQKISESDRELIRERYSTGHSIQSLAARMNRPPHRLYYSLEKVRSTLMLCIEKRLIKEGFDVGY